jgi:hypothetical protein
MTRSGSITVGRAGLGRKAALGELWQEPRTWLSVGHQRERSDLRRPPNAPLVVCLAAALMLPNTASAQEIPNADEVAKANNPLAPITAINFQNYYLPTLYLLPAQHANTLQLRAIFATTKMIVRATLPVSTAPTSILESVSGLGDLNVFDAFLLTEEGAKNQFGVGPLLVAPTATDDALGDGKWQGGAAVVVVTQPIPTVMIGGLVTYQHSFAGDSDRPDASLGVVQPFVILQFGGGYYARSSGVWEFDLENDSYVVPFGVGVGKVMKAGRSVLNIFLEPQFTVMREGIGQPSFQVFGGINVQFPKGAK